MRRITGRLQAYDWGSTTAIPAILGVAPTGEPQAEYWLGAHPSAPATVDGVPLDRLLDGRPEILGRDCLARYGSRLPYLMKLLAAAQPLSLQAHPNRTQAEAGYAREEAAGLARDAYERTYKDDWPKPEAVIALEEFHGLCGFRDPARTTQLFAAIGAPVASLLSPLEQRKESAALAQVFLDVLSLEGERLTVVDETVAAARAHVDDPGEVGQFARTAVELHQHFPGDKGILAALLLNRLELAPGEGVFLAPGNMHAYLSGTSIEVMANSDNVLRGGLTRKHIDVEQLLTVVDFRSGPVTPMPTVDLGDGVTHYLTGADEFTVWRVDLSASGATLPGDGARILLVTSGTATASEGGTEVRLAQGEAVLIPDGESVRVAGSGQAYLSGPGAVTH